ncbi:hypothetical protein [Serratia liquefaciens]|jgi:hypothetical protein|uniref:hypothetical protein n=1 Tax=Serratia liquefaciens TaxID=614 RepID=UPI002182769E|nr:hypothetical protein [Serratia liquefaciens]CAI2419256.1 Uncharacterised protein [Serratia liquefaciens]
MPASQQKAADYMAALNAMGKISSLAEAALFLTANATERAVQIELIGVISDIANTIAKEANQ